MTECSLGSLTRVGAEAGDKVPKCCKVSRKQPVEGSAFFLGEQRVLDFRELGRDTRRSL